MKPESKASAPDTKKPAKPVAAKDLQPKKDPKGGPWTKVCWVAREVYGVENPAWSQFRDWLLGSGPTEFVSFYKANGAEIAREIEGQPKVKELIRHLMDAAKR
jgi:hypothetical protein